MRAINKNNEEIDVAFSISPTMVDGKTVFMDLPGT
jgi:hypothetical protein